MILYSVPCYAIAVEQILVGASARGPATAGYTVNTYSKPPLYYTLGAVAPLLACVLRTAQILGPGGPLPHAKNEVDRTTRCRDMAKPSADRQTDTHVLPTNQPTSQPFCQYPAVAGNCDSICALSIYAVARKNARKLLKQRNYKTENRSRKKLGKTKKFSDDV